MMSLVYILLAIFSLTFLIFIHEFAHYWMARRVGMRVETFSIGFGSPIYKWVHDGVQWQIGWLPFGGFVRIAGMDGEEDKDPYSVPDGFFGKSPWDRIKVLAIAPIVNILFAFLAFTALWAIGGRTKNFVEYTPKIGWVDESSELYEKGVRPGDEILAYDGQEFKGAKDHLTAAMMSSGEITVEGNKVDFATLTKEPFSYTIRPHTPAGVLQGIKTTGVIPASYVIYDKLPGGIESPISEGSPMFGSGIQYGDRIIWVDGEQIFSHRQLSEVINDGRVLLTVKRGDETFLRRVPRASIRELKISSDYKEELVDWQYEANLNGRRFSRLQMIPYELSMDNTVERRVGYFDDEAVVSSDFSEVDKPLQSGDEIIAVDGVPVSQADQLLKEIQQHRVHIIVERDEKAIAPINWREADQDFDKQIDWNRLQQLATTIGTSQTQKNMGDYYLLNPVTPRKVGEILFSPDAKVLLNADYLEQKKQIEAIEDPEKRKEAMEQLESRQNQLFLGLPGIQDRKVSYNPNPFVLFADCFNQVWRTLYALVSGNFNPKWMSGPVGIVQVVHQQSMVSLKEMLYWIGFISLNLGVLNLLPIPVLDGGSIVMAFYEMVTRRRIKAQTMERLVIPFAVLLIGFFIFVTYHDLSRIFGRFLPW